MNLGSLFSGLGVPPQPAPQPYYYNSLNNFMVILIVVLIIIGFGRNSLGFGGYGLFNFGPPAAPDRCLKKHHKHHKHHKHCCKKVCIPPCPPPVPQFAGLGIVLVLIAAAILIMPKLARPIAC